VAMLFHFSFSSRLHDPFGLAHFHATAAAGVNPSKKRPPRFVGVCRSQSFSGDRFSVLFSFFSLDTRTKSVDALKARQPIVHFSLDVNALKFFSESIVNSLNNLNCVEPSPSAH
jgi:hypothetical protein